MRVLRITNCEATDIVRPAEPPVHEPFDIEIDLAGVGVSVLHTIPTQLKLGARQELVCFFSCSNSLLDSGDRYM